MVILLAVPSMTPSSLQRCTKGKTWPVEGRQQAEGVKIFSRIYKFPGRLKLSLRGGFCLRGENSQVPKQALLGFLFVWFGLFVFLNFVLVGGTRFDLQKFHCFKAIV